MSYPNQDDENNTSQEKDSQLKAQKEMMLKQVLSADARLRLNNVRMVKPDLADLVENYILNLNVTRKDFWADIRRSTKTDIIISPTTKTRFQVQ